MNELARRVRRMRADLGVAMSAPTAKALHDYVIRERPRTIDDAFWLGHAGEPLGPSGLASMLRRRSNEARIRHVHAHLMRHTFALSWARAGGPLHALQSLLGHSTPTQSLRYGRASAEEAAQLHRQFSPVERLGLRIGEKKGKK